MAEYLRFDFNGEEIEATPENTTAYTFREPNDHYDHLYYMEDPDQRVGAYIFKLVAGDEQFWQAVTHMINNEFLCILNQPSELLTSGDRKAYENLTKRIAKRESREIPDTLEGLGWDGED